MYGLGADLGSSVSARKRAPQWGKAKTEGAREGGNLRKKSEKRQRRKPTCSLPHYQQDSMRSGRKGPKGWKKPPRTREGKEERQRQDGNSKRHREHAEHRVTAHDRQRAAVTRVPGTSSRSKGW